MAQRSITSFFQRKSEQLNKRVRQESEDENDTRQQNTEETVKSTECSEFKKSKVNVVEEKIEDSLEKDENNDLFNESNHSSWESKSNFKKGIKDYSRKTNKKAKLSAKNEGIFQKNNIATSQDDIAKRIDVFQADWFKSDENKQLCNGGGNSVKDGSNKKTELSSKNNSPVKDTCPPNSDKISAKSKRNGNNSVKKVMDCKTAGQAGSVGSEYNPNKARYHPINDAIWERAEKVPYLALAITLREIEDESARLKIIEILSNFFRSVIVLSPKDLLPSIYLCLNKLGPVYDGIELGVAETNLIKAIAQCTGRQVKQIKADAEVSGDLGIIAECSRANQRTMFQPAALTVESVFVKLKEIALLSGKSAVLKKIDKIQALFVACKPCECRYVIRSLAGKLRIGLAEQSVLQALALACVTTPPNQQYPPEQLDVSKSLSKDDFKKRVEEEAFILKTAYCECPNYDMIVAAIFKDGIRNLSEHCKLTPGIPMKPMLAQPTKCISEVFQQFDGKQFTCEWKYDGERAQIHLCEDGKIKIYSRNMEDNTSKYPDIISTIRTTFKPTVKTFVIDTETVAWDKQRKSIMPFQVLSTRKRKDASESEIKVQVRVFMFDLLYLNGRPLVQEMFAERRRLLKEHFVETEERFSFVNYMDTTTIEEVQDFLDESVKGNCEGLMVKSLQKDADYKIAKRARTWLKLKKDYLQGIGDTLDLVVIGGYLGKGKRTGAYGGFLLACYDAETEDYQSICKIGTGFSDEDLASHTEFLKSHVIEAPKRYYRYDSCLEPDHWFDAVQVWEIKCADLSLSPIHKAAIGIVDAAKGISLRFPRFLRIRDDKKVEEATSAAQVNKS